MKGNFENDERGQSTPAPSKLPLLSPDTRRSTMPAMPGHFKAAAPRVKGKVTFKPQTKAALASGSSSKRKRPSPPSDDDEDKDDEDDEGMDDEADVESEVDTDDEIATAQAGKSKKTASE